MRVNRALIVGAGIGGMAAAVALVRKGVDVEVVEIKPDPGVLGVGINQPGNALRALDTLGVLNEVRTAGFAFEGIDYRDWHDNRIVYVPSSLGDDRVPANVALTRNTLADILCTAARRGGARLHYGVTVDTLEEGPDDVTVTLTDGRTMSVDLVAAFDGIRSATRRRLFGDGHEPVFTGCSGWRLPLARPSWLHHLVLYQGDRVKAGLIPLSTDRSYLLLVTEEPDNPRHDPAQFHRLLAERLAGFEGPVAEIRHRLDTPDGIVYSPLVESRLPRPWHRGRVVVLGDAAHAMAPHLTQGASMALEDAVVLADEVCADRPLGESLTAFTDLRYDRVRHAVDASRAILEAERHATAENLPAFAARARAELPGQVAFVEARFNEPYRSPRAAQPAA